jgi:transposase-like protein
MTKKGYKTSKEVKEQIINRIKNNGVSVAQAAEDAGVSTVSIYNWLGTKAQGTVSLLEHNKIKKENQQLKEIIGELTIRMSMQDKRGLHKN